MRCSWPGRQQQDDSVAQMAPTGPGLKSQSMELGSVGDTPARVSLPPRHGLLPFHTRIPTCELGSLSPRSGWRTHWTRLARMKRSVCLLHRAFQAFAMKASRPGRAWSRSMLSFQAMGCGRAITISRSTTSGYSAAVCHATMPPQSCATSTHLPPAATYLELKKSCGAPYDLVACLTAEW